MSGRTRCLSWLVAALAAAWPVRAQSPGTLPGVRADVALGPDTATVGDPVTLVARVTAPAGATIEFPVAVATGDDVEALDPRLVEARTSGGATVAVATWRVVGWRPGSRALPLGEAVVTLGAQQWRLPLETRTVVVRSVLPADTARRVPRPARDALAVAGPWWERWWPVALALVALLLAVRAWKRRRRSAAIAPEAAAVLSLDRLDALALAAAGEPAREVALAAEIVRVSLMARWPEAVTGLTTAEVGEVAYRRIGPLAEDVLALLAEADLVKFARRPVTADESRAYAVRARRVLGELAARVPRAGRAA
ncbi:MAG: hypothetical protein HYX65_07060 [Gemmatimonadetes bacterium]|nr:hypothetical protein [Gemmatimonadota bacterium]